MSKDKKAVAPATAPLEEETVAAIEVTEEVVETPEVDEAPSSFVVNGKNYTFSSRCPKRLKFDGIVYSQEELLNNEEILASLVIGQSPFVKKI